jgi:hypothetical protein
MDAAGSARSLGGTDGANARMFLQVPPINQSGLTTRGPLTSVELITRAHECLGRNPSFLGRLPRLNMTDGRAPSY